MKNYADHPQAKRIYSLASRRRPANWKSPPKPVGKFLRGNGPIPINQRQFNYMSTVKRSKFRNRQAIKLQRHVTGLIRKGWPTGAYKKLLSPRFQKALHPYEVASSRAEIAHGYFIFGKDDLAIKLAEENRSKFPEKMVLGEWAAGLAAWRSNKINKAQKFFENVARSSGSNSDLAAAGAFWASRCYLLNQRPKQAISLLKQSASFEETFYGMISARALGFEPVISFDHSRVSKELFSNMDAYPQLLRMLALLQIKKYNDAEKEIRSLFYSMPRHLRPSLMTIAADYGMPGFAMRSAGVLKGDGYPADLKALYPFPSWELPNEVEIDAAFIYAMVRQESQFYSRAMSRRGARGLMQLMPRTAASIGKTKRFRRGRGRDALFDPKTNLILGSKYLLHLMQLGNLSGNLFKVLAAYNAGPGNLRKWERKLEYKNDPLLFIESIPSRETRHFIKKVMLGLWVYRFRLNELAPTLSDVAGGNWPKYMSAPKKKL
jgi:soluble lytic murein transglycosylase-like protein